MTMFERFSRHARVAVVLAQEEAKELNASAIGPEHLLVGVLQSTSREFGRELAGQGLTAESVRKQIAAGANETTFDADADALRAIGIDLHSVRDRVDVAFGPGSFDHALRDSGRRPRRGKAPFGKPAKKALELALREAIAHRNAVIDSEHLLLGILRGGDPVACGLISASVDKDVLRSAIGALLDQAA
jgi:ATP-dependent Clp protease ATP-binding subunit ClpA